MFNGVVYENETFMAISTLLVFIMTPGLAFFYGGLVEKKNSLTIMLQIFLAIGVVGLLWIFGGFSLVFGKDIHGIIGNPLEYFGFKNIMFSMNSEYGATIPFILFFLYQLMFAIITLPLMTGAMANRMNIGGWIIFLIVWMIVVYFPVAHWVWGGGFLSKMGFVDFAGGSVIHVTAGFSGLAAVIVLGKRKHISGKTPFNLGLVAIGSALLLFGWFGFNSGGVLAANGLASIAFANTGVAAIVAMVVWTIISYINKKRFSLLELFIGGIAGLAAITPASGYVTPTAAMIIGGIAAIFCFLCVRFAKKMGWDDVLDVWGTHGMGGVLGTLSIGIFSNSMVNGIHGSLNQFLIQLFGATLVAAYSLILTLVILKLLDRVFNIRTTEEQQRIGLDKTLLDETYNAGD
ncbi:ammonium transporter [uncultured Clostridium sp.]|uniref:ammonium transporter n=1 Tax=uncultured Clostridium sp. TaxID=59620 RepID=UPI00261B6DA9|nr:ammonium transporter [uncultured Clostridium sp.]